MDLEPGTENGKILVPLLTNWMNKSSEPVIMDKLKRMLVMYSSKMKNQDEFISALYGQAVLDESPSALIQQVPTVFLRLQHAIETSLRKKCSKEFVVALEWSQNENFLALILNWADKNTKELTEISTGLTIDLAPQRIQKRWLLAELTPAAVTPRHREIDWNGERKECGELEVCRNTIIVGWNTGEIKIYSSTDLRCQTVLPYYADQVGVNCLQCTCTEIIAGYGDGKICVWDIASGILVHTFPAGYQNDDGDPDYPCSMRWKDPKLIVETATGRVKIWQYVNSSFTLLGNWVARVGMSSDYVGGIHHIELNDNFIVRQGNWAILESVHVTYCNGRTLHTISNKKDIECMAVLEGYVITGGNEKVLRIWDIRTGVHVRILKGHDDDVLAVGVHDDVIASIDRSGKVIVWRLSAAVEGRPAMLTCFTCSKIKPEFRVKLKVGPNFLACSSTSSNIVEVTDFES